MGNIKKNLNKIVIAVLTSVIIMLVNECSTQRSNYEKSVEYRDSLVTSFTVKIANDSTVIAVQVANVVIRSERIRQLENEVEEIGKLKSKVVVKTKFIVRNVPMETIVYNDSIVRDTVEVNLPLSFYRGTPHYSLGVTMNKNLQMNIDSLIVSTTPTLYYGYEKWKLKNLIKKREPIIVFKDKNPYIRVTSIENIVIEEKPNRISVGIQAGYGMTNVGLSPYLGLGVQYNIIK